MRVEPIRDAQKLREIEARLKALDTQRGRRMYLMFVIGIYLSRRISDLIGIKVKELRGKEMINLRERKTGKYINMPVPKNLREILSERLDGLDGESYVLQSRKSYKGGAARPITRRAAYNDMREIAREMGVGYNIGTHTLRKTFGYHYYQQTKDIAMLMVLFNHSSESMTKRYIGLEADEIYRALDEFKF